MKNLAYSSNVEIVTINGDKFIDKRLRASLSQGEAEELRQKVLLQRSALEEAGVPISKLEKLEVERHSSGQGFGIYIREQFAGLDFMDVVNEDNYAMYLDRLLKDVIKPFLRYAAAASEITGYPDHVAAGLDPALRNFVYNNRIGTFCYVDFIPPKVYFKGGFTQEIPECPDEDFFAVRLFGHNYVPGIIYNFYINLAREFPLQQRISVARIEQFMERNGYIRYFSAIAESPLYRTSTPSAVLKALDGVADWRQANFYLLREIANWLNFYDPATSTIKREVYRLTSQEREVDSADYGTLSAENFSKCKKLLRIELEKLI